jgi:hypothetical protein
MMCKIKLELKFFALTPPGMTIGTTCWFKNGFVYEGKPYSKVQKLLPLH